MHSVVSRHKLVKQTIRLITLEYRCWKRSWNSHHAYKWIQSTLINLCCLQCVQTHVFIHWKLPIIIKTGCYYSCTFSFSCFQKILKRFSHTQISVRHSIKQYFLCSRKDIMFIQHWYIWQQAINDNQLFIQAPQSGRYWSVDEFTN